MPRPCRRGSRRDASPRTSPTRSYAAASSRCSPVIAGLAGKAVEIRECVLDQPLAHGRRAGQVLDRVVIVEQHRVRQLAHVVETPLGTRLLRLRDRLLCRGPLRLPGRTTIPPSRLSTTSAAAAVAALFRRTNLPAR